MTVETFIRRYTFNKPDICKDIINWFEEHKELQDDGCIYMPDGTRHIRKEIKESTTIFIPLHEAYGYKCLAKFLDWLWTCVNEYIQEFSELNGIAFSMTEPFNIQKYTPPTGGFKQFHLERQSVATSRRLLVFMLYLNNIEDQGGTEFKYYKHTEKAEEGKLLIWPPDFTHTHRGIVSSTETKYIITGWYSLSEDYG